jgi:ATP-dependent Zn protease
MSIIPTEVQMGPDGPVHLPIPDDREPKTRPRMMMWDRVKVVVLLAGFLVFMAIYQQSQVPIMSFGEALSDELRSKWWILVLIGLEVIRQVHYMICEHAEGYNHFWNEKVWGRWERRVARMNQWKRYRLDRAWKRIAFIVVLGLFLAWQWNLPFVEALVEAPGRLWDFLWSPAAGMPIVIQLLISMSFGLIYLVIFFGIFFIGGIDHYKPGEIKTRFRDVWGQDPVLGRVKETVDFLERPDEIEAKGGYVPGGILLWGPPGTGKTLMAEAVAGETGKPYVFVDPSSFQQTFLGVAPMKVKHLYRKLRKQALKHGGVIVFFDEADVLGNRGGVTGGDPTISSLRELCTCNGPAYVSRPAMATLYHEQRAIDAAAAPAPEPRRGRRGIIMAGMGGGGGMGALQALLSEMSGLRKPKGFFSRRIRSFLGIKPKQPPKYRILHIFATNRPDTLDEALMRPGRIDRKYKVGYPHAEGRRRTFQGYFDKIRHDLTPAQIDKLSVITPYYSGAKIKDVVNEAVIVSMREGREIVTWPDVLTAKMLKSHGEADDWKYTALERHQVAIHEACHAVAMYLLRKRHAIDVATIQRRGDVGGFVSDIPLEERFGEWRTEMEIDVMTFLASLAGERLFFADDNSGGVGGDLRASTMMVTQMLGFWGMGSRVGSRSVTIPEMTGASSRPSDGTDRLFLETDLGKDVEAKLQELLARVRALLDENRWFVFAVAHALEAHLTITGEDIEAIYQGTVGPTLDGATYHTAEFLVSYEAYHLTSLDAHRSQERPDTKLPELAPVGASGNGNGHAIWAPPEPPGGANGGGNGHHGNGS